MAEKALMIFGVLCTGYFVGIAAYAGLSSKFPFIWAVAGFFCFALAFLIHRKVQIPAGIKIAGLVLFVILLVLFVTVESFIIRAMVREPSGNLDYLIVLGAQVKGDVPSLSLKYRIDEACEYLKENPDTRAILSGGQGVGENISEAECMRQELLKMGIEEKRLIKEDYSTNTGENIDFSYEILKKLEEKTEELKVGIVTNDFHVYRGTMIAKKKMDSQIQGLPARSNAFLQVNYLVREFLGVVKDKMINNL